MKHRLVLRIAVAACAACLFGPLSGSSDAAPIDYTEPTSGVGLMKLWPAHPSYGTLQSFTLDRGINRVRGKVSGFELREDPDYDLDGGDLFNVVVPQGLMITRVFVEASNFNDSGTTAGQFFRAQGAGMGTLSLPMGYHFGPGGAAPYYNSGSGFLPGTTAGPGTYSMYLGGLVRVSGHSVEADYRVSMTVALIPEPSALAGLTIAGLTLLARRRRA